VTAGSGEGGGREGGREGKEGVERIQKTRERTGIEEGGSPV